MQLKPRVVEFRITTFKTHVIANGEIEGRPDLGAFCIYSTLITILVSYCYPRSRAVAARVYIRFRLIPVTLMILDKGTLLFSIVIALIRAPIECSLQTGVVVPEADALVVILFGRAGGGAKGASSSKLESELKGILYHSSSSSSSSLLERLAKESVGSNLLLDNLKSGKLNKSDSIVKIKGE